jgi:hypothetical protein
MKGKGLRVIELMVPDRERNLELHKQAFHALTSPAPAKTAEAPR